ncbi:MAG: HAD family hydrolase [Candidatus Woesearchaeota archaeon]
MVKAIFFDFWGTLVENGVFPSPVRQAKQILRLQKLPFPLFIIQFERAFMIKHYDDLYKAFESVCEEFKITPNKYILDSLVGMWNKNKLLAKPFPETIEILEKLQKKYELVLISNTDCFSVQAVLEKYDMAKYFKEMVLSFEVGMLKSKPEMFNIALEKLKLSASDVVMVGDSIESDMTGAKNAGISAILIDRTARREFTPKIMNLKQLEEALNE